MAAIEVLPIRAVLYTPENKRSAFVYMRGTNIVKDRTKEYQGAWVADGYTIDKKKTCTEVWIFADDDEMGIDKRVLGNNPMRGNWGYKKHVDAKKASKDDKSIPASDMLFFPPDAAKCRIPADRMEYIHRGTWIKPTYKRDFSQLGSNKSGFLTVSGDMRIAKGEKHSVTGKWNMMGFNDDIVRGRKKKIDDGPGGKGQYQIYVRTIKGVRFPINAIPSNKISQVKKKIHQKKGIPIRDQMLSFKDVPLKDDKTVSTQGIRNGDTIDLNPITIYVRDHKGKKYTFNRIDPDELVKDIKNMVEKREGTPVDEQQLYFQRWKLDDDCNSKPISHFKIRHKSVLDLVCDDPRRPNSKNTASKKSQVIVKMPDGKSIPVPVEPDGTIKDVKKNIAPDIGLPPKDFKLCPENNPTPRKNIDQPKPGDVFTVLPSNGHSLDVAPIPPKSAAVPTPKPRPEVIIRVPDEDGPPHKTMVLFDPQMPLGDLDDAIRKETGVPKDKKKVFHLDDDGNELPPDTPVKKAGIRPGTTLDLVPTEMLVTLCSPNGREFVLLVDPINDKPNDIRSKAATMLGFPVKDIKLYLNDEELDDGYKPSREQIIDVAPQIEVTVPDSNKKVQLFVLPNMTIGDLEDVIEEKTGIPKTKNRVFFFDDDGKHLNQNAPVSKTHIKPGVILEMKPTKEKVTLRSPNGREFVLLVDPINDKPDGIRRKAAAKLGCPVKDIKLYLNDEELDVGYKPSREQIIEVASEVEVLLPDRERKVSLSVLPSMTIGDLEDVIEEKTGIPKTKNRVFFVDEDGNALPSQTPAAKTEAYPGAILEMKPTEEEEITLRSPNGRGFFLSVDPINDTENDIRERRSAAMMNIMPRDLRLNLDDVIDENTSPQGTRGPAGRSFTILIDNNAPTKTKMKAREKVNFGVGDARIDTKVWVGDIDDVSLEEARGIRDGGILDPDQVEFILPSKKKIVLSISPTMTLAEVKAMVIEEAKLDNHSAAHQAGRAFFMDSHAFNLDDNTLFEKLKLAKGQRIEISTLQLTLQHWDGSEHTIAADSGWYIQDIQDEIFKKTQVRPAMQRLFFNGIPLLDHKQLGEQGLMHQSIIKLEKMEICIEVPTANAKNRMVRLAVEEGDFVKKVKTRAAKKAKVSFEDPCLVHGGVELLSTSKLADASVQHGDICKLEEYTVNVVSLDGENLTLKGIKRSSTIGDLKNKIHQERDIPICDQKLLIEGRQLRRDKATLKKEQIPHRARIVLEPKHVDIVLPDAEKKSLKKMRKKNFKSSTDDEIWPVDVDLKHRFFFFDNGSNFDANIEVKIMHWSGQQFTLDCITPTMKVDDLKDIIYSLKGIEKKKQKLKLNGRLLNGKQSLLKAGVHHHTCLTLDSPHKNTIANPALDKLSLLKTSLAAKKLVSQISIRIRTWKKECFKLKLLATAYIDDVVDEIAERHNVTLEASRLMFQGQPTSETMTLTEQGITDGSVLEFVKMSIFVQIPSKKNPVTILVEHDHTIGQIKRKLAMKIKKIPVEKQCIMFGGEELINTKTVLDYSIDHGDTITLEVFRIRVIQLSGEEFDPVGISRMSTINDIKAKIAREFCIDPSSQKLLLKGEVLNDVLRLCDQGVEHGAILFLEETHQAVDSDCNIKDKIGFSFFNLAKAINSGKSAEMCLHIKHWNGDMFIIKVQTNDYPDDIREKIRTKKKIPVENQRLKFHGQNIDDAASLAEQGICDGTTLELGRLEISLELPNGKTVTVETTPDESILRLKRQIKEKTDEAIENQNLMFGSDLLENTKKISAYNLEHGDTILLEHFAVRVTDWHGNLFEVDRIQSSSNVAALQKRIEEIKGIPPAKQILKFSSQQLNHSLKLSHQGINHRSVLVLEPPDASFMSPIKTKVRIGSIAGNDNSSNLGDWDTSRSTMGSLSSLCITPKEMKSAKKTSKIKSTVGKADSPESSLPKGQTNRDKKSKKLFNNVKKK